MNIAGAASDPIGVLIKAGQLNAALNLLQAEIRKSGAVPSHRMLLVQLFAVMGQWDRVGTQLEVLSALGDEYIAWAAMMSQAVRAEALRAEVFAGRTKPIVLGEPPVWIAPLIQAMDADSAPGIAARQRAEALAVAPATAGEINGIEFSWLSDADSRLGPLLEVLMDEKYYWVPFERLNRVAFEPPTDLRHLVWLPARFTWTTGGESSGWVPSRYPGSESCTDDRVRLGRLTTWEEFAPGSFRGLGQRMFTSSADEHPFLETRLIEFRHA